MFAELDEALSRRLGAEPLRRSLLLSALGLCALTAATLPLVADEAYYLWWATSPELGYLDHPPAVMLWAWLSERLWGPRASSLLSALAAGWLLYDCARALKLQRAPLLPLVVLLTPFGVALSVLLTPDVPLALGWCVTLWAWARLRPVEAGLGAALMLWSKPSALLPLATLALAWLWRDRRLSRARRLRGLCGVSAITLCLYAPQLWWSSAHDWLPWSFQAGRPLGHFGLIEWLASQLWLISPFWAYYGLREGLRALSEPSRQEPEAGLSASLALIGLGQLVAWALISLVMRLEGNWSALAWPPLLLLCLDRLPALDLARALRWGATLSAPLFALPLIHLLIPLHLGPPRDALGLSVEVQRCLEAAAELEGLERAHQVIAARYQEMALLWRAKRQEPSPSYEPFELSYLNASGRRSSEFERRPESLPQVARCDFLYLGPPQWLQERCDGQLRPLAAERCLLSDELTATLCRCDPQ